MVDVRPHGIPPQFKRSGVSVSAGPHYPRDCGMFVPTADSTTGQKEAFFPKADSTNGREKLANFKPLTDPAADCPVLRKYPPPKIRKGVTVIRDFPPKLNAPASLRNQKPSDWKVSNSVNGTAIPHCKQWDVFNAIDDHACTSEQDNLSMVANDCKTDVEESNLSGVVCDEQCQVDNSIATGVYECRDVKESSFLSVVENEQCEAVIIEVDDDLVVPDDEENDCLANFGGKESVEALEMKNSQVVVTNIPVIVDKKQLRIARDKVREVLDLFKELYLELSQHRKRKGSIPMEVASLLQKQQKWINTDDCLGSIPGVEVGDCFNWRGELSVIGLHHEYMSGIDYMLLDGKILATSVVDSGEYDNVVGSNDGEEFADYLIYSGQGENPKFHKKPVDDQKLERGNLALKNSAEAKTPIRVIRKFSSKCAGRKIDHKYGGHKYSDDKYVYDGLYFVEGYREEKASYGKLVFKFLLKRLPGQEKLGWTKSGRKEYVCVYDISRGKERVPVRAINMLDDEKPPSFNYITNMTYLTSYCPSTPMPSGGCNCTNGCSDSEDCPCVVKNDGEIPYNYEECILIEKPLIIECGPSCKCFTSCLNRVSQRGICFPLELFKTKRKGWGVRSRSSIPCGSFICEYIGEVLPDKEVEQKRIGQDEYLFDIGNYCGNSLLDAPSQSTEVNESFTIDAAKFGNVGRFINHSCSPNLFAQNVLFDHSDKRMPHVMLFARDDIPPLEELCYDYNYRIGEVCDVNGNTKEKACYCGSPECNGRMY